jgi:ornithine cyclodeaminase/alanine dehydrogenase-like protein (mu-crystallin family)
MYINIFIPDSCNMTQETEENKMSAKIDFLYLSEPDMIKAGVKDMAKCVEVMEDMMVTLKKGDYVMGGENHNSHGCMVTFPDNPEFEGMPKNGEDRRFMAMPAYLGGNFQMAGMKWYGSKKQDFRVQFS